MEKDAVIYLDNHATTPCDPRVVDAMLRFFTDDFANPHSSGHSLGREAADSVDAALREIAGLVNAPAESVIVTSGATESTNLAVFGTCLHPRQKRRQVIVVSTEHSAVRDPANALKTEGFEITCVPVDRHGLLDLAELQREISERTALVSVMWANNEIGTIAPMAEIAEVCHRHGTLLHSDATQAVGRLPVDMIAADVDLLSFSAHKFYGPKGVGALIAGNGKRRVRLKPRVIGGGQQGGLRSGTLAPANVVGLATALRIAHEEWPITTSRIAKLRDRLLNRLQAGIEAIAVNGFPIDSPADFAIPAEQVRLPGNLNVRLPEIEGEAWLAATPEVAFSSGAACSSAEPRPSHVLTAIGLRESEARRSVRFGIGRFTTMDEVDRAAELLTRSYHELCRLA